MTNESTIIPAEQNFSDAIEHVERIGFTIHLTNTVSHIEERTTFPPYIIIAIMGVVILFTLTIALLVKRSKK